VTHAATVLPGPWCTASVPTASQQSNTAVPAQHCCTVNPATLPCNPQSPSPPAPPPPAPPSVPQWTNGSGHDVSHDRSETDVHTHKHGHPHTLWAPPIHNPHMHATLPPQKGLNPQHAHKYDMATPTHRANLGGHPLNQLQLLHLDITSCFQPATPLPHKTHQLPLHCPAAPPPAAACAAGPIARSWTLLP